jgi:hypothetical protein
VTTRPETEITIHGGAINNLTLENLDENDARAIINNSVKNDHDYRNTLLKALQENDNISTILLTPMSVDIFIYTYRSLKLEPRTEADFYSQIFICIASQHDRLKMLERPTLSGLSIYELELVFNLASFILVNQDTIFFTDKNLKDTFTKACNKLQYEDALSASHLDVINISNLIIPDGLGCYSYIHKSIMEYNAAAFITSANEETQNSFYQKVNMHHSKFARTLQFLFDIDTDNFLRFYAKPIIKKADLSSNQIVSVITQLSGIEAISFGYTHSESIAQPLLSFFEERDVNYLAQTIDGDSTSLLRFTLTQSIAQLCYEEIKALGKPDFLIDSYDLEPADERIILSTSDACHYILESHPELLGETTQTAQSLLSSIEELIKISDKKENDVNELMDIL